MSAVVGAVPVQAQIRVESDTHALSAEDQELVDKWQNLKLASRSMPIEEVRFLMKSGLAYWIETFKNSSRQRGEETHGLRYIAGKYCMNVEGRFVPVADVCKHITYDPSIEKLVTKGNVAEIWSYVSPQGLVKRDRMAYASLLPIEEIHPEYYAAAMIMADTFWSEANPEVDPGKQKHSILQIATTNRVESDHWLTENAFKCWPEHTTFRVIRPDGKVYSFGFEMEKKEKDAIHNAGSWHPLLNFTKTTLSKISTPDYEESRSFNKKRITSIPLTEERAAKILEFIERQNEEGVSFNYIRQNCATLGREVLKIAGVRPFERWKIGYGLTHLLPNWEKVPYVGKAIYAVVSAVKYVVSKFFQGLWAVVPDAVAEAICFVPRKITTLLSNTLVAMVGGARSSNAVSEEEAVEDELDNRERFTCFSRLLRKAADFFRDDLSDVDAHLSLIDWQEKQRSTKTVVFAERDSVRKIYFQ